jgi:hypothetical protein
MGKVYTNIIRRCLDGDFSRKDTRNKEKYNGDKDKEIRSRLFLEDFKRLAVLIIERPIEV